MDFWVKTFERWHKELPCDDASHGIDHLRRVAQLALEFAREEGGDELVLLAAAYFHDIVNLPKNHPHRHLASTMAAEKATDLLRGMDFPEELLPEVAHAIEAHSFSAAIPTRTKEAAILQDADRMEALGVIGAMRTFYVSGLMGSRLMNEEDPLAERRSLDDKQFAVDHFEVKLFQLPSSMKTSQGQKRAEQRKEVLVRFRTFLIEELKKEERPHWEFAQACQELGREKKSLFDPCPSGPNWVMEELRRELGCAIAACDTSCE